MAVAGVSSRRPGVNPHIHIASARIYSLNTMDYRVTYWNNADPENTVPDEGIIKDVRRCIVETNGILKFELSTPESDILFNTDQWIHVAPFDSDLDKRVSSEQALDALYEIMDDWKYRYIFEFRKRINAIIDIMEQPNI